MGLIFAAIFFITYQESDRTRVVKIARADCLARVDSDTSKSKFNLRTLQENFAIVEGTCSGTSGYHVTLKKVEDTWVIVEKGQETPSKGVGKTYGLPQGWYSSDY